MNYVLLLLIAQGQARMFCEQTKLPLEVGKWSNDLVHLDSAVVENKPVSMMEGQYYVYENDFPGYIIRYILVDNVAIKSCGASASIKSGGVGTHTVLVVLHADAYQEIRSVIDVWGSRDTREKKNLVPDVKAIKSLYLFEHMRALNHNRGY